MDRRQKKTRGAIFAAFGALLSQKGYGKITVQEIIDAANVGRSTFYAHFETKDDLLRDMCTDLFDHVFSDSLRIENTHDFSRANGDVDAMITHMLYHLRDNRNLIAPLLTGESGELFLRFFKQYLNDLVTLHMLKAMVRKNALVPDDFLVHHISGAFVEMVHWWLRNDMMQAPEEMAKYFASVIYPII